MQNKFDYLTYARLGMKRHQLRLYKNKMSVSKYNRLNKVLRKKQELFTKKSRKIQKRKIKKRYKKKKAHIKNEIMALEKKYRNTFIEKKNLRREYSWESRQKFNKRLRIDQAIIRINRKIKKIENIFDTYDENTIDYYYDTNKLNHKLEELEKQREDYINNNRKKFGLFVNNRNSFDRYKYQKDNNLLKNELSKIKTGIRKKITTLRRYKKRYRTIGSG
ncbi:hypothetical protein ACFL2K_01660 [Candidatus Margulisiibacteriota bacterium]